MAYEIWHKRTDGTWELVEWGYGPTGDSRLEMYQKRHPKCEFRIDKSESVATKK